MTRRYATIVYITKGIWRIQDLTEENTNENDNDISNDDSGGMGSGWLQRKLQWNSQNNTLFRRKMHRYFLPGSVLTCVIN